MLDCIVNKETKHLGWFAIKTAWCLENIQKRSLKADCELRGI